MLKETIIIVTNKMDNLRLDTLHIFLKIIFNLNLKAYFLKSSDISKKSLKKIPKIKPKCIFYLPGGVLPIEANLMYLLKKYYNSPIILFSTDDMNTCLNNFPLLNYIDCVYTNSLLAYKLYSCYSKKAFFLPWGFDEKVYGKVPHSHSFNYDVAFFGNKSPYREYYLKPIEKSANYGIPPFRFNIGLIENKHIVKFINETKINLDIPRQPCQLLRRFDFRIWEITGAEGFLLCEYAAGIEKLFEVGKEIVCFKNKTDLIELIRWYLKHDNHRKRIAINGRLRVRKEYNLLQNFWKIINMLPLKEI